MITTINVSKIATQKFMTIEVSFKLYSKLKHYIFTVKVKGHHGSGSKYIHEVIVMATSNTCTNLLRDHSKFP